MPNWKAIREQQERARRAVESDLDRMMRLKAKDEQRGYKLKIRLDALERRVAALEDRLEAER